MQLTRLSSSFHRNHGSLNHQFPHSTRAQKYPQVNTCYYALLYSSMSFQWAAHGGSAKSLPTLSQGQVLTTFGKYNAMYKYEPPTMWLANGHPACKISTLQNLRKTSETRYINHLALRHSKSGAKIPQTPDIQNISMQYRRKVCRTTIKL